MNVPALNARATRLSAATKWDATFTVGIEAMKLRLLKAYSMFGKGDTIDVGSGVAELLVLRKIAEPIDEEKKRPRIKNASQQTVERFSVKD